jgi:hypothetical protein
MLIQGTVLPNAAAQANTPEACARTVQNDEGEINITGVLGAQSACPTKDV